MGDFSAESGEEFGEAGGAAGVFVETREDGGGAGGVHVWSGGEFCGGEVTAVIFVEFLEAFGAFLDDSGAEGVLSGGAFCVTEFAIAVGVEGVGWLWAIGGGVFHGLDEGLAFFDGEFAVFIEVVGFEDFREFAGTEGVALGRGGGLGEGGGDGCGEDGREEGCFEEFHEEGGFGANGLGRRMDEGDAGTQSKTGDGGLAWWLHGMKNSGWGGGGKAGGMGACEKFHKLALPLGRPGE